MPSHTLSHLSRHMTRMPVHVLFYEALVGTSTSSHVLNSLQKWLNLDEMELAPAEKKSSHKLWCVRSVFLLNSLQSVAEVA
jgi:hypothetical protein